MFLARTLTAVVLPALAFGAFAPAPAQAAGQHHHRLADVWADFQAPVDGTTKADTLHWYAMSPVVTRAMVGKQVRYVVSTPRTLDCNTLGAGWSAADDTWWHAPLTVRSCSATRLVASVTVTRAMVGQQVALIGWTATAAATGTVRANVAVAGSTAHGVVTASRTDAPAPVGPLQALGQVGGRKVSLASANDINEVWVGAKQRYGVPSGTVVHSDLTNGVVHLLVQTDTRTLVAWTLDVSKGVVTQRTVDTKGDMQSVKLVEANGYGYIIETTGYDQRMVYNWDGVRRYYLSARFGQVLGLAGEYLGVYGNGQTPTIVSLIRLSDGNTVSGTNSMPITDRPVLDRTNITISYHTSHFGSTGVDDCILTLQGNTCTPRQG